MTAPDVAGPPEDRDAGRLARIRDLLAADLDAGFELMASSYSGLVYSLALRLTGSAADADDLSQETLLRAYASLRSFTPQRCQELKPGPWLATIGTNLWRNRVRDRVRSPVDPVAYDGEHHDVADAEPGPEQLAMDRDGWGQLAGLVAALPEHHRLPVVLRHVVGLSYAELAEALRCPVGTAKAQVSRGVATLRCMIEAARPAAGDAPSAPLRPGTRQELAQPISRR